MDISSETSPRPWRIKGSPKDLALTIKASKRYSVRVYTTALLDAYGITETYPLTMGEYMLVLQYLVYIALRC